MRNPDLIPEGDGPFAIFTDNFMVEMVANHVAWNIPMAEVTLLQNAQSRWVAAWEVARNKNSRTKAQVTEKSGARKAFEAVLRPFIQRFIVFNPLISNSERFNLGIKPRKAMRTRVAPPTAVPVFSILGGNGGGIRLYFRQQQNAEGSSRRAMPQGVRLLELQISDTEFSGDPVRVKTQFISRSPFLLHVSHEEKGAMRFVRARWVNTRGEPGPWSREASFIVC